MVISSATRAFTAFTSKVPAPCQAAAHKAAQSHVQSVEAALRTARAAPPAAERTLAGHALDHARRREPDR